MQGHDGHVVLSRSRNEAQRRAALMGVAEPRLPAARTPVPICSLCCRKALVSMFLFVRKRHVAALFVFNSKGKLDMVFYKTCHRN